MRRHFPLLPVAVSAWLLASCAAQGPFPSLAQRPGEGEPNREPVRTLKEVPADASLQERVAELVNLARSGQSAFDSALESAERSARTAGAQGSDSWVSAQEQLSRLEAARAPTTRALADLDALGLERSNKPVNADDWSAIEAALSEIQRVAATQHDRIEVLKALIAR